jgi:hypothetical protein
MSMLPTPMGMGSQMRANNVANLAKRVRPALVAVWLLGLLCLLPSCQLINRARVPAPERALASEGENAQAEIGQGGSSSSPGEADVADHDHDHEPDLLQAAQSDDDPTDDTPGEGPNHKQPSLDRSSSSSSSSSGTPAIASRYAGMDRQSCEGELAKRHIAFERVGEARGVIAPLRLKGPLSGVTYRSNLSAKMRETAVIEIYDCRLVLALDDFARILAKHDIVEVIHLSVYRPVSPKIDLKGGPGRRHNGALAIDAAIFKTKDGKSFDVQKDFKGRIGAKPCPAPNDATELRKIACEANQARLFNVLLTPDYNWAHRNHFHMEVTAGVRWTLVR